MSARTRFVLLCLVGAITAGVGFACGSTGGGGGAGPTPAGCDSAWRTSDPAYATDLLATLAPGGAATLSNGTLVLTFSGTLPASSAVNGPYPTGVFYAKRVLQGDFAASVQLLSYSATATNLAAFFSAQSSQTGPPYMGEPHGERYWVEQRAGGAVVFTSDWYGGTAYFGPPVGPFSPPRGTLVFTRRGVKTFYSSSGAVGGFAGSSSGPGNGDPDVIGLGIVNREPMPVTGSMTVRFSGLQVVDTSGNCFTSGLD